MENIMQMKIGDIADIMVPLYASSNAKEIPSVMIWGPPGVGKSAIIKSMGTQLAKMTGKTIHHEDVRLLLFNPVDLRGIPVADAKRELAIWLKPKIFQMDPNPNIINILFLDEISAAPPSVQAAAYQITLDRVVGEHKLPDNCIIIAAGNRVTDKSVAYKMPKALTNRMVHIEAVCEIDDWKKWAIPAGIDPRIVGWLNYKNSALFDFDPSNDDVAYPTPRSWEMVDKFLKKLKDITVAYPLIVGSIGLGASTEFKAYTQIYNKLPDIRGIYNGTETAPPPTAPDILYALSSALVSYAPKATKPQLVNLLEYTGKMKAEFAALTIKDIVIMEDVRNKMMILPEWVQWSRKYKDLIM